MTKGVRLFLVVICTISFVAIGCSQKESGNASTGCHQKDPMSLGNVHNYQSKSWHEFDVDIWTDGRTMPPIHGLRVLLRFRPKEVNNVALPKSLKLRLTAHGSACDTPKIFVVEHQLDASEFTSSSSSSDGSYVIALDDSLRSNQTKWTIPTPQSNQLKLRDGELRVSVQMVGSTVSGGEDKLDFDDLTIKCQTMIK
jgi:hypothetical protein